MADYFKRRGYFSILLLISLFYFLLLYQKVGNTFPILNFQNVMLIMMIVIIPLAIILRIFLRSDKLAHKIGFVVGALVMNAFVVIAIDLCMLYGNPLGYKLIDCLTIIILFGLLIHATTLEDKSSKEEKVPTDWIKDYLAYGARYAILFIIPTSMVLFLFYMIMIIAFRGGGPA